MIDYTKQKNQMMNIMSKNVSDIISKCKNKKYGFFKKNIAIDNEYLSKENTEKIFNYLTRDEKSFLFNIGLKTLSKLKSKSCLIKLFKMIYN